MSAQMLKVLVGMIHHIDFADVVVAIKATPLHNVFLAALFVAGGYFTNAGGVSANRIAAWDGLTWQPFGTGLDSAPIALARCCITPMPSPLFAPVRVLPRPEPSSEMVRTRVLFTCVSRSVTCFARACFTALFTASWAMR